MADDDDKKDYDVGYGKPPKHGQFKKGESGRKRAKNPKKRFRSREDAVAAVRDEMITIQINGRSERVTAFDAMLYKVRAKVMQSGSVRELKQWMELMEKFGGTPPDLRREEAEYHQEKAMEKISLFFERTIPDDDPELDVVRQSELAIVHGCASCMPRLNELWSHNDCKPNAEQIKTELRRLVYRRPLLSAS